MLHRNPNKRPTLESIVNDPFFAGINWKKLEKMQIEPPSVLKEVNPGSTASQIALQNDEELAMLFESPDQSTGGNEDEQRGGSKSIFQDEDYREDNRTYNRVKNYSFARAKWIIL